MNKNKKKINIVINISQIASRSKKQHSRYLLPIRSNSHAHPLIKRSKSNVRLILLLYFVFIFFFSQKRQGSTKLEYTTQGKTQISTDSFELDQTSFTVTHNLIYLLFEAKKQPSFHGRIEFRRFLSPVPCESPHGVVTSLRVHLRLIDPLDPVISTSRTF